MHYSIRYTSSHVILTTITETGKYFVKPTTKETAINHDIQQHQWQKQVKRIDSDAIPSEDNELNSTLKKNVIFQLRN